MGSLRQADRPSLVELGPVQEFWTDGAEPEVVGEGVWRLRWYKRHRPPGEPIERVIQVDLLIHAAHIGALSLLFAALAAGELDTLTLN